MKAIIISDREYQSEIFHKLQQSTLSFLQEKGFEVQLIPVGQDQVTFCMGCFRCWTETPGECVIPDQISQINRLSITSEVVILLCPVIFGQFSANLKNVVDRWLPNMLPFFEKRSDGSTMHPPRYAAYPRLIMIGYGNSLAMDDQQLFIDITKKHRPNVEVLIYQEAGPDIAETLDRLNLQKVGGCL